MPYYPLMMDWGYYPFMGFWMSLTWLIVIIVIVYFIYKLIKNEKILAPRKITSGKTAEDILNERYANGEAYQRAVYANERGYEETNLSMIRDLDHSVPYTYIR